MKIKNIGWIGLGKMGIPMAQKLINVGYAVTVYNRSKAKIEALSSAGASTAESPVQLVPQSEVIFLMVSDDQATREIFTGETGLLNAPVSGKIFVNMSTVSPGISQEMARMCREKQSFYLDAPVSGSVKQAEEGQLVIMVGSEEAIFHQVKPLLDQLGKLTLRVGETGAGNSAKLAINTLLGFYAQGLAEAVIFAQQHGIQTQDLLTLIGNSALGNIFTKIKGEAIVANNFQPAFALKHIAKDLRLAQQEGSHTPLAEVVQNTFQQAESTLGEEDVMAIIKHLNPINESAATN
ncbi:NAD(P)-dependent oxidoreductase [Adhaeribacter pallidiroseus]|uniref:3-hydroxyisobutyrate dehydrogenase n=1 Tax=Adhaeribacter pallidiroseus TaxID=2072847 RepID=A0A369QN65_9BACT|nr:NAD(P)-dependent oxidoreductase [Adhaeribacter pallidiroseus]RDC66194.1 3-hydroxyisobutyrate dehydrogenase [Adhaeribacter pallidiroseus]